MTSFFLLAAGLSGLFAIACEERAAGRHPAFYLLKPLTTLLVLAAAALASNADPVYRGWILAGLLLSTCGDIALTRPGNAAFIAGLGSFLVAHGLFVCAFLSGGMATPPAWILIPLIAGLAFFVWLLPRTGALRGPVLVYGLALVAMMLAAAARGEWRDDVSGLLATVGAVLFLVSDSALAVRQFQGAYPRAQALILSTYWLSVGLIAASTVNSITVVGV